MLLRSIENNKVIGIGMLVVTSEGMLNDRDSIANVQKIMTKKPKKHPSSLLVAWNILENNKITQLVDSQEYKVFYVDTTFKKRIGGKHMAKQKNVNEMSFLDHLEDSDGYWSDVRREF